jgi:hypothetical protein
MLEGRVTLVSLSAWLEANKPDLGLHEDADVKGFYLRSVGPAHGFQSVGPSWRDVAAALGAISRDWGGPGRGGGRPANIAGNIARLARSIAAEERRPTLRYEEAEALRQQVDALHERLERLVAATPDYPNAN